jgi:acyl-CoA synthetase (AMP-forming)/AMP-acid ligase II
VKRCRRSALAGFDLSGLRGIVLGAERIDTRVLDAFLDLVTAYGASRDIFVPAYGLAESTVGVTGAPKQRGVRTFTVDTGSLALGTRVASAEPGAAGLVLVSCGSPLTGVGVRLLDEDGSPVGDDMLGEIEVSGTSLASSYLNADGTQTPLGDAIRTGDAGFLHDGELYVVGRLGDGVKELGRWVFAEDLEAVAAQVSPAPAHTVALTGALNGRNTGVVLVGADVEDAASGIGRAVREAAGGVRVLVYSCSSAAIRRTTSGKPMRRAMWTELTEETTRAVLRWDSDNVMPA